MKKHIISDAKGFFLNYYLWRNIKVGTLCFSAKSLLATPRFNVCKSKNNVNLFFSLYFHCSVFWIASDFSIHLIHFTSELQMPITFLFVNENIKCGYAFS